MCGIAGVFCFRESGDLSPSVEAMLTRLERRGPDDRGVEIDGDVALGNRRLAIIDLTAAGHQPMVSQSGRFAVTFNGEIYNYMDLRRELGLDPARLRSRTDTEILLAAWERWGERSLDRLVGQWAFAIHDRAESRLFLARDRFGEKPLYYHANRNRLAFASSLSALLAAPDTPRELDPDSLLEYVTLRYVVSPRTVLAECRKLPPGHLLEVGTNGTVADREWFAPRFARTLSGTASDHAEEFDQLFQRACERCLIGDRASALLLSDGIDSNAVRAALSARHHALPSFTFRLTDPDHAIPPARLEAGEGEVTDLGVSRAERLDRMQHVFSTMTEPVGDGAALATWMLIHAARSRATVFLCGHGGDELLGGYRLSQDRFRLAVLRHLSALPQPLFSGSLDRFLYGSEPLAVRRAALRRMSAAEAPASARYLTHRPLPSRDVGMLFGREGCESDHYLQAVTSLYAACDSGATDLDRMQEVMLRTFLPENILSFADSAAMDSSAELRMPFLDRDLASFVFSLPSQERVSRWPGRANTKLMLRKWAAGRVPKDIVRRRKRSFSFGSLSSLLAAEGPKLKERVLGATAVRRALPGLERWLARDASSFRGPWEGTMWALLALAAWCETVGVQ
jgi:asparagine synthase (glutamine-hydrolysing)